MRTGSQFDIECRCSGLEFLEDLVMLSNRLGGAAGDEAERRITKHLKSTPPAVHEFQNVRVRARLEENRVELQIQFGKPVRVEIAERRLHTLVHLPRSSEIDGVQMGGAQRGCRALNNAQQLHREDVFGLVDEGDLRPDVALESYEPLGFKESDGLAHGDNADVEFTGDGAEH